MREEPIAVCINLAVGWRLAHDLLSPSCPSNRCDPGCWQVRQGREVGLQAGRVGKDETQDQGSRWDAAAVED